jgi:copper chaperone CopZ
MKKILFGLLMVIGISAQAQFSKGSLQASGLTCSMCSKAVKNALEKITFLEKVQVDIKNQQYNLTFKEGASIDFDALSKAVEDAGFSVASLKVTASVKNLQVQKDDHVKIGGHNIHFLNSKGQLLNGDVTFSLVDKSFVSAKEFKKYASMTKMECMQSGRMAKCCAKEAAPAETERIYHAVI